MMKCLGCESKNGIPDWVHDDPNAYYRVCEECYAERVRIWSMHHDPVFVEAAHPLVNNGLTVQEVLGPDWHTIFQPAPLRLVEGPRCVNQRPKKPTPTPTPTPVAMSLSARRKVA